MEHIKWGIVGPGKIAAKFASDLNLVEHAVIEGVASRNKERAQAFASEFGVNTVFDSYEELFKSKSVDVLYIATPHVFHKELAIQAMKHGKHILCEKPMGVNKNEVVEMVRCAKENGVFLMEALWSRFHPTIIDIKGKLDNELLGNIRYLNADFAFFAMDRDQESRLLNPSLAGGSLLDIGIYPVFLSYLILGMPKKISANATVLKNGLESQVAMLFEYENAHAILYSGFTNNSRMSAEIAGERGNFYLDSRWHEANGYTSEIDGEQIKIELPKWGNGYTHEIEEVHKCLKVGKLESELWSLNDSKNLISLLDEIRNLTSIKFPFE
ncbi:Gfo/Idh/MocA family oxidoreductase [Muricauda sp. DJ-13]|uniref:Gfo/Idh/MocA family oxidoreductase n=2 Tax=Croceivirga thetidis TaxID=2721623 RepID=A0ABX1GQB6_9FLAO|nr:Gfo/Idh/MocA family oxidoreductase [Croceivirga thetidis]